MDKHQAAEAMAAALRKVALFPLGEEDGSDGQGFACDACRSWGLTREEIDHSHGCYVDAALSAYSQATAAPAITADLAALLDGLRLPWNAPEHNARVEQLRALLAAPPPAPVATREPVARVRGTVERIEGADVYVGWRRDDGRLQGGWLPAWAGVALNQPVEVEVFPATTDKGERE